MPVKLEIPRAELFKHWQTCGALGFVGEYFDSIKALTKKCCLSLNEVKIWASHLQIKKETRAKVVQKAKETRAKKKQK